MTSTEVGLVLISGQKVRVEPEWNMIPSRFFCHGLYRLLKSQGACHRARFHANSWTRFLTQRHNGADKECRPTFLRTFRNGRDLTHHIIFPRVCHHSFVICSFGSLCDSAERGEQWSGSLCECCPIENQDGPFTCAFTCAGIACLKFVPGALSPRAAGAVGIRRERQKARCQREVQERAVEHARCR